MFGEARRAGCTVVTFTMPDLRRSTRWPRLRDRVTRLNAIIRSEAERFGVLVVDFAAYPVAADPRLWFDDRLHGNTLGHTTDGGRAGLATRHAGFDESWAEPLPESVAARTRRERITGTWTGPRHYLAPWVGKGIRGLPARLGVEPKRPVPTIVPEIPRTRRLTLTIRRFQVAGHCGNARARQPEDCVQETEALQEGITPSGEGAGREAVRAPEGPVEGGLGAVAHPLGDPGQGQRPLAHQPGREVHPPGGHVADRGLAHQVGEPSGERRSGQAGRSGERLQAPRLRPGRRGRPTGRARAPGPADRPPSPGRALPTPASYGRPGRPARRPAGR